MLRSARKALYERTVILVSDFFSWSLICSRNWTICASVTRPWSWPPRAIRRSSSSTPRALSGLTTAMRDTVRETRQTGPARS